MITHTSDSHQIPSQNKTKSKLQILEKCQKFKLLNLARNFTGGTPSEVVDKRYKYEIDPARTVGATERTQDAGWTDRRSETNIPSNNFVYDNVEIWLLLFTLCNLACIMSREKNTTERLKLLQILVPKFHGKTFDAYLTFKIEIHYFNEFH